MCYKCAKPIPDGLPVDLFWEKVEKRDGGCWLWIGAGTGARGHAYGAFKPEGKSGPRYGAHRVSWVWANGRQIPDGMMVCHRCDAPKCVNPDHLFLGTSKQNSEDMVVKKRQASGVRQGGAKLTEEKVIEIRQKRAAGRTTTSIAMDYGVTQALVSHVCTRRIWKHVA